MSSKISLFVALTSLIFVRAIAAQELSMESPTEVAITTTNGRTYQGVLSENSHPDQWTVTTQSDGLKASTTIPARNIVQVRPVTNASSITIEPQASTQFERNNDPQPTTLRPDWIETTAQIRNLDQDEQPDGLEIRIVGLSKQSGSVPLRGSVDARWIGMQQTRLDRAPRIQHLARWSRQITPENFQGDEVVLYVPFRGHPGCELRLFDWTQLQVRVNSPGQGSWDATATIQLRQYDPFQEQLLLQRHRWSLGNRNPIPNP